MKIKFVTRAMAAILVVGVTRLLADTNTDALTGSDVLNKAGETIGKLKEFVLDQNSKTPQFAVVESGGTSEMGAKSFLVPWEAFQVEQNAEDNTNRVILDATTEKLQGAVEYDSNKPIPAEQVYAYWGIARPAQSSPEPEGASKEENTEMPD